MNMPISAKDTLLRKRIDILDSTMTYVDVGAGTPIVFLHGNPTSSYLWRNIIPHVSDLGRCLAPDLVGFGESGKSASGSYHFADHKRYLDAWFDKLDLRDVVLVLHDWGSALGFSWANRHRDRVKAIAYMEALVQPRRWEDFPNGRDQIFRALRSDKGESLALDNNFFVETVLPKSVLRELTQEEMDNYRRPFATRESRLPTLQFARELPIEGSPADVAAEVEEYSAWLSKSKLPKLFFSAEPGALIAGRSRDFCKTWPNQIVVEIKGVHYVQEDSPHEIGEWLRSFVRGL